MGKNNKRENSYQNDESGTIKVFFNNTNNFFLTDIEDWNKYKEYTWYENGNGYAVTTISGNNKCTFYHDIVMNFVPTKKIVCDHINRNRLDNRKVNLRIVDRITNNLNTKIRKDNKTGKMGVFEKNGKWCASIGNNNKSIWLGTFENFEEAILARKEAEIKHFGMERIG